MLGVALFLSLAPGEAGALIASLARELSEGGAFLRRIGGWLQLHNALTLVAEARMVALADGVSTAVEGVLLYQGRTWGAGLVIGFLALLIPAELVSLERHPSPGKLVVLAINAVVVAYLVRLRLRAGRAHGVSPARE